MNLLQSNSILLILGFALAFPRSCHGGESSTCLIVYKEGGAPAVFQSPKCPRWSLSSYHQPQPDSSTAAPTRGRCQWAMLRGRRKYQEDRILCAHDLRIPLPGKIGLKEVRVDMVAVFDGHNGAEASEMASKLLLEYFALHTYFLLDATYSLAFKKSTGRMRDEGAKDVAFQLLSSVEEPGRPDYKIERFKFSLPDNFDDSFHLEILKEALLRAIHDIDTTFSKEASRKNLKSGSTAAVVLLADGKILAANLGDSKALLCSEKFQSPEEAKASLLNKYREQIRNGVVSNARNYRSIRSATSKGVKRFHSKELTQDHHPDREDEKIRVEAAGGYILETSGVARVNGELAVSRAIGDLQLRRYGVISLPEVTNWQPLTASDSYLVVASDGVFEKLGSQEVCDILWEAPNCGVGKPELSSSRSYSLAECLVETAFVQGSMDNIAVVVVPLRTIIVSETLLKESCAEKEDINCSSTVVTKFVHEESAQDLTSELAHLEHRLPLITEFSRLLVEAKYANLGCYYLDENLNNFTDAWKAQHTVSKHYSNDLPQALPEALDHHDEDGFKGQCPNPEGFSSFLGLLESIPFPDSGSSYVSTDEVMPDLRYLLKKRFGRGAYGEVWLAFHWNCHQETNGSDSVIKNENISSDHGQSAGSSDGEMFILKRIMVERGPAVYLSGLREKYFGEMFSNASKSVQGISDAYGSSFSGDFESDFDNPSKMSESFYGLGTQWVLNGFVFQKEGFEEGLNHIARYIESFESKSNEMWLVFRHEGVSLSKIMYTVEEVNDNVTKEKLETVNHAQVLRPSLWWHWLKTTEAGKQEMRIIIRQLLMALKSCHSRNVTHRDIKPENMVVCFEDAETGRCLKGVTNGYKNYTVKMRIIDFGSAVDDFTMKHFYGSSGPSRAEQTYEYSPPEAFLNASWHHESTSRRFKVDPGVTKRFPGRCQNSCSSRSKR